MGAFGLFLKAVPLWVWVALGLLAAGLFYGHTRYNAGQADIQEKYDAHLAADKAATDKANAEYRAKEQKDRDRLAELGFQHERDKMAAQDEYERTVACLRSGGCGMQKRWSCPTGVSQAAAGSGEPDASERDRQESAARIVLAADLCDAQVKGLQSVILTDRE
jgi:prophage endopeptidase